jgi:hypothetical protein
MPLTEFQTEVFRVLSVQRNPDSYAAGGIVIHREPTSVRYSRDIDIFHDTSESVISSSELDATALRKAGYAVEFSITEPTFHRATVLRDGQRVRLEWAADSAFRFFPIVPDQVLGYRLHDADVATNKVLAAAGRVKVRDFIDLMQIDRDYVSLGVAIWAATGKDEGFTPELIIDQLRRNCRINPDSMEGVKMVQPADPVALKKEWLECFTAAEALMETFPSDTLGCLYLDQQGRPARGKTFDRSWVPHHGCIKGAWPKIVQE